MYGEPEFMTVYLMHPVPIEEGLGSPGAGVKDNCEVLCVYKGSNPVICKNSQGS